MKAIFYFILFFIGIFSIFMTLKDIVTNQYFIEFDNIKSLKYPNKYMETYKMKVERIFDSDPSSSDSMGKFIEGNLLSDGSHVIIGFYSENTLNSSLDYQPVYKSKLTGKYYLKGAPKRYYSGIIRGQYFSIFLKIVSYFILIFLAYKLIKYQ